MEKLKLKITETLKQFENGKYQNQSGFEVLLYGGPQLHLDVQNSKFDREYLLPKKNNWDTNYFTEDGDWCVGIDNLNKKELDEVIDLFSENWSSLYHQNTYLSDLIEDDYDELRWEE